METEPLSASLMTAKTMFPCHPSPLLLDAKKPGLSQERLAVRSERLHLSIDDETKEVSNMILAILKTILLTKIPLAHDRWALGCPEFLATIGSFVQQGKTVQMCLPAFPLKSVNKVEKVLGMLPDKAEELSLRLLNDICKRIGKIYPPGAEILIISDGLVYSGKRTAPHPP